MNNKEEQEQKQEQDINSIIFTSNDLLDDEYYSTWDEDYEFYKMKIKNVNKDIRNIFPYAYPMDKKFMVRGKYDNFEKGYFDCKYITDIYNNEPHINENNEEIYFTDIKSWFTGEDIQGQIKEFNKESLIDNNNKFISEKIKRNQHFNFIPFNNDIENLLKNRNSKLYASYENIKNEYYNNISQINDDIDYSLRWFVLPRMIVEKELNSTNVDNIKNSFINALKNLLNEDDNFLANLKLWNGEYFTKEKIQNYIDNIEDNNNIKDNNGDCFNNFWELLDLKNEYEYNDNYLEERKRKWDEINLSDEKYDVLKNKNEEIKDLNLDFLFPYKINNNNRLYIFGSDYTTTIKMRLNRKFFISQPFYVKFGGFNDPKIRDILWTFQLNKYYSYCAYNYNYNNKIFSFYIEYNDNKLFQYIPIIDYTNTYDFLGIINIKMKNYRHINYSADGDYMDAFHLNKAELRQKFEQEIKKKSGNKKRDPTQDEINLIILNNKSCEGYEFTKLDDFNYDEFKDYYDRNIKNNEEFYECDNHWNCEDPYYMSFEELDKFKEQYETKQSGGNNPNRLFTLFIFGKKTENNDYDYYQLVNHRCNMIYKNFSMHGNKNYLSTGERSSVLRNELNNIYYYHIMNEDTKPIYPYMILDENNNKTNKYVFSKYSSKEEIIKEYNQYKNNNENHNRIIDEYINELEKRLIKCFMIRLKDYHRTIIFIPITNDNVFNSKYKYLIIRELIIRHNLKEKIKEYNKKYYSLYLKYKYKYLKLKNIT